MSAQEHMPQGSTRTGDRTVPVWALLGVTWLNSLGSGILWSGVPFVAERQYGFTERENLALALAESVVYVVVALRSGPLLRAMGARTGVSPRGWLAIVLAIQAAASTLALAGAWGVVAAGCIISAAGAAFWPVMESYVSSGRHGGSMRRALGAFNVTWMSATAVALLAMGPLVASGHANLSLLALVPASLGAMAVLRAFPSAPAPHEPEHAHTHIAPQYPFLLRATRWVLPTSYVFISVLGPVLPYLVDGIGIDEGMRTPLASLWMFVRTATVVALAYLTFWHGRWATLAIGVAMLVGGFAIAVTAGSAGALAAGLATFGAGHGIIYYSGLYYAMAVGGAEVDAGGHFEALIGAGYVVGPLAGLAGARSPAMLVAVTVATALVGLVPAMRAWAAWRRSDLVP
jgi:cytochrome c oxidase subunit IV